MGLKLFDVSSETKKESIAKLVDYSTPRQHFYFFVILSIFMAAFGLLNNNVAVVIGSMLIAPVLYPILSLGLGVAMSDAKLMLRSLNTLGKSILISLIASLVITLLFSGGNETLAQEIVSRTKPNVIDVAIAFVAGLAASFALVNPKLNETIPGIAISVSLVPPLTTIGIGLAKFDWALAQNAFLLFFVNAIGITFTSVFVFSIMNFYGKKTFTEKQIKKEDKTINEAA